MAVSTETQRPNTTCCASTGTAGSNRNVVQSRQVWMTFHRRRPPKSDDAMVTTPMSWPGCRRPPAGLGNLESDRRHRLVSTANNTRTKHQPRRLAPINPSSKTTGKPKGTRHRNERSVEENETGSWAKRWAEHRSKQINVTTENDNHPDVEMTDIEFKRACAVPRQKRREKVVELSEKEAASMQRLRGVYANTKEKTLRAGRLQESIKALQDKTLHTEVDASLREYHRKVELDKDHRSELKRVRDRYFKDKKRRTNRSHISLTALESPQVSRHAYGLPEEGKEFEETMLVQKTEIRLKEIWQKAVRRAITIDKFIKTTEKEPELTLPKIIVKQRPSLSRKAKRTEGEEEKQGSGLLDFNAAMMTLDDSSSDSDDDDELTDIGEED